MNAMDWQGKIGQYILFGGMGLVDGLADQDRANWYRIISVGDDGLRLKGYRRRKVSVMPWHNLGRQEYLVRAQAQR